MSDYISRESALKAVFFDPLAANRIRSVPAVDVVERKKGRWEHKLVPVSDEGVIIVPGNVCSACGGITTYNVSLFKYCPRCGADMGSEGK